jgi:hypothetical protein
MFGNRALRRELRKADAEIELLTQALRIAHSKTEEQRAQKNEWQARAERFSNDRVAAAQEITRGQLTVAQQQIQLADWSSLAIVQAERHGRLIRAVVRYRGELREQALEIADLRKKAGVPDRAVDPAHPTPALVRVTRERDEARALLRPLQDRLEALQRLTEAEDRRLAPRAGTARQDIVAVAS